LFGPLFGHRGQGTSSWFSFMGSWLPAPVMSSSVLLPTVMVCASFGLCFRKLFGVLGDFWAFFWRFLATFLRHFSVLFSLLYGLLLVGIFSPFLVTFLRVFSAVLVWAFVYKGFLDIRGALRIFGGLYSGHFSVIIWVSRSGLSVTTTHLDERQVEYSSLIAASEEFESGTEPCTYARNSS
jgi:hypothetical protein